MNKKNKIVIGLVIFILIILIVTFGIISRNNEAKKSKLFYRVYTEDGWSSWYSNNQVAGEKNKKITAIEVKVNTKEIGSVLYNTYSEVDDFNDNNSYNSETAGDKKHGIYGVKIFLTEELYNNYNIYYKTYNKKDGWLDWSSDNKISGDNGVDIEQIQIKLLNKNEKIDEKQENTSIGF